MKNYFSGSNSGTGFFNRFDGIVPEWEALTRYFMIKGGPGVGKSTLMKEVVKKALEQGEEVECFYCSGDPDSLDGVRLVERGIVFADATSPHAMDPKYPGAVEEIVSLGDFIVREKIVKYRDGIEMLTRENKRSYERAYAFLAAAAALETERYKEVAECINQKKLGSLADEITEAGKETGKEQGEWEGCAVPAREDRGPAERRLFLDAISCKGCVSFAPEHFSIGSVYRVTGAYSDVVTDLLGKQMRVKKKEVFCDPLCPGLIRHMKGEGVGLTCEENATGETVSSEEYMKRQCHFAIKIYEKEALRMKENAMLCLKECKKIHDELESIYRECVAFSKVSERTGELLSLLWPEE